MQTPNSGFRPKQCLPQTPEIMALMMGECSLQVARHIVSGIPKMAHGSLVHDNACGNGVVTQAVIESQDPPPGNISIVATDLHQGMCDVTARVPASHGWTAEHVKTAATPSEDLSWIADNSVAYSVTGFVIFGVKDSNKVASEIYRTLKPGGEGVGFVTTWAKHAAEDAGLATHKATRPASSKFPMESRGVWKDPAYLKQQMEKAGFKDVEVTQTKAVLVQIDMRLFSKACWSFMGASEGGWLEQDEEKFEEAVDIFYKTCTEHEIYEPHEDGKGGKLNMVANIATFKK